MACRYSVRSWLGLGEGRIEVIDLTTPLSENTPVIDLPPELGRPWRFEREVISRYDSAGPDFYWNNIRLSEHTGTHFDAPVHWLLGSARGRHQGLKGKR